MHVRRGKLDGNARMTTWLLAKPRITSIRKAASERALVIDVTACSRSTGAVIEYTVSDRISGMREIREVAAHMSEVVAFISRRVSAIRPRDSSDSAERTGRFEKYIATCAKRLAFNFRISFIPVRGDAPSATKNIARWPHYLRMSCAGGCAFVDGAIIGIVGHVGRIVRTEWRPCSVAGYHGAVSRRLRGHWLSVGHERNSACTVVARSMSTLAIYARTIVGDDALRRIERGSSSPGRCRGRSAEPAGGSGCASGAASGHAVPTGASRVIRRSRVANDVILVDRVPGTSNEKQCACAA